MYKRQVGIDLAEVVKAGTYDAKVNRNITINKDAADNIADIVEAAASIDGDGADI